MSPGLTASSKSKRQSQSIFAAGTKYHFRSLVIGPEKRRVKENGKRSVKRILPSSKKRWDHGFHGEREWRTVYKGI